MCRGALALVGSMSRRQNAAPPICRRRRRRLQRAANATVWWMRGGEDCYVAKLNMNTRAAVCSSLSMHLNLWGRRCAMPAAPPPPPAALASPSCQDPRSAIYTASSFCNIATGLWASPPYEPRFAGGRSWRAKPSFLLDREPGQPHARQRAADGGGAGARGQWPPLRVGCGGGGGWEGKGQALLRLAVALACRNSFHSIGWQLLT